MTTTITTTAAAAATSTSTRLCNGSSGGAGRHLWDPEAGALQVLPPQVPHAQHDALGKLVARRKPGAASRVEAQEVTKKTQRGGHATGTAASTPPHTPLLLRQRIRNHAATCARHRVCQLRRVLRQLRAHAAPDRTHQRSQRHARRHGHGTLKRSESAASTPTPSSVATNVAAAATAAASAARADSAWRRTHRGQATGRSLSAGRRGETRRRGVTSARTARSASCASYSLRCSSSFSRCVRRFV
jgi:hypothetical protein